MYLRDIDISLSEALQQVFGSDFNTRFPSLSFSTTVHFLFHLSKQKLETGDVRKACIKLVDTVPAENARKDGMGILFLSHPFDLPAFAGLNAYEQKRFLLEMILDVLNRTSGEMGWDSKKLQTAFDQCLQDQLIYERMLSSPIRHPSRNFNVKMSYRIDPYHIHYFAHLFPNRSSKQICKKLLGTTRAHRGSLSQLKEPAEWLGGNKIRMKDQRRQIRVNPAGGGNVVWTDHYWEVTFDEII